jgi:hypothetical protein
MFNSLKLISLLAVFGALFFGPGEAQANDDKAYMASFCRATSGTITYGSYGEIANASTSASLTVECPIARDELLQWVDAVNVTVRDRHLTSDISCRLRARASSGSTSSSAAAVTSGATAVGGYDSLSMLPGAATFDPGNASAILLVCTLPAASSAAAADRSAMYRYLVAENS